MDKLLSSVFIENKIVLIGGDFNIEMKDDNVNKFDMIALLSSFRFVHTISDYTRVTSQTKSCIDNIFVNFKNDFAVVLDSNISDHSAQKISFSLKNKTKPILSHRRFFNETNIHIFLQSIQSETWENVLCISRPNVNE